MLLALLLMLGQEAPPPPPAGAAKATAEPPKAWSIKVDPCASARNGAYDIVVCGNVEDSPRLPLPAERDPPDRPLPSNPNADGMGALAAAGTVCRAKIGGCTVGVDLLGAATFLVRATGKAIDPQSCCDEAGEATNPALLVRDVARGVGRAFRKKDKRPRIPIPLDDAPLPAAEATQSAAKPEGAEGAP